MVPTTCLSKKFKPSLGLDLIDSQSSLFLLSIFFANYDRYSPHSPESEAREREPEPGDQPEPETESGEWPH